MLKVKLNIQRFAVSASISGENYGGNSSTNKSYIRGNITISTSGQTHNYDNAYYQINGGDPHYFSIGYNSTVTFSYDGLGPYQHNPDGTLGDQTVSLYVHITSNTSTSASTTVRMNTIQRYAKTNSVTGSNIEGVFKVNYTKYKSSWKYKLRISIPNVQELEKIDYNTSNEEFSLTEEVISQLFQYTTASNTVRLGFAVETWNSAGTSILSQGNEVIITAKIVDANPIFTDFEFEDANTTTTALTGNNQNIIKDYSNVKVTISTANKAIALKGSTMSKYRFAVGNSSTDITYSDNTSVNGTINKVENGTFNVYAIDSRNNSTLVTKLANSVIEYEPIVLDGGLCNTSRDDGGVGTNVTLNIGGTIWNKSFGSVTNSIKSIKYYLKETSSSEWIEGRTVITPVLSGNSFSWSGLIKSDEDDYKWLVNKSYDIKIEISDELSSKTLQLTPVSSGIPNISFADDGVGIMCDYDENKGGELQVGGNRVNEVEVYSGATINFTAPFTGIIELKAILSAWGYGGGEYTMSIDNTLGNATLLNSVTSISHGHDNTPVPLTAISVYKVEKGVEYTFVSTSHSRLGGFKSNSMIGILRRGY